MSRTRQAPNELTLYLYKRNTTDTSNYIEDSYNEIGIPFKAEDLGERTKQEKDVLSGRVLQSTTSLVYRTRDAITLDIGDNIALVPNADENDMSTIVSIRSKLIHKRGARHNTNRVKEVTFEVS